MDKLDLVRVTLENRETSVCGELEYLVGRIETFAERVVKSRDTWSSKTMLDYAAGNLEDLLRQCRDLQARDLAVRELRTAYDFLVKE